MSEAYCLDCSIFIDALDVGINTFVTFKNVGGNY